MQVGFLTSLFADPCTRGRDVNDPATTLLHAELVRSKGFLRAIYDEWYRSIARTLPEGAGALLELGSGPGFLKRYVPDVIASDLFPFPGVSLVADACRLPLVPGSLRGLIMTNVLHHLSQPRHFLEEATRCLRPGGVLVMVEPWVTSWSRLVYSKFHHEPFEPTAVDWEFLSSGPRSGANGALPWIIFSRDRARFEREFPDLHVESVTPFMPFRYLLSGGVSLRSLQPKSAFPFWRAAERSLKPFMGSLAMFCMIALRRTGAPAG
jgi:SAM-dependent methyltransferase